MRRLSQCYVSVSLATHAAKRFRMGAGCGTICRGTRRQVQSSGMMAVLVNSGHSGFCRFSTDTISADGPRASRHVYPPEQLSVTLPGAAGTSRRPAPYNQRYVDLHGQAGQQPPSEHPPRGAAGTPFACSYVHNECTPGEHLKHQRQHILPSRGWE